jgi:hypothetical protein
MSMKKILMAAVAVTALTAGSANAAKFDLTNTKLGTIADYTLGIAALSSTADVPEAFTIANEYTPSSSTIVYNKIVVSPTTTAAIGQGNYVVTFNLTGGEFSSPSTIDTTFLSGTSVTAGAGDVTVTSMGSPSATSVSFNVTVATGKFVSALTFKAPVLTGTARTPISMSGSITTGGSAVDGGTIAAIPLVDYRNGYAFTATRAATVKLSILSGFKKFGSGVVDATSATLGSVVGFVTTNGTGLLVNGYQLSDYVFKNTSTDTTGAAPTNLIAVSDISSIVATVAGDFSSFDPYIGTLQQTSLPAAVNGVMTLDTANLAAFKTPSGTVGLKQKATAVAGNAASYSISAVPTITGLAGSVGVVYPAKALASTALEGTNIYASWVGDGSNGFNYTIRLGNLSPSAISSVKAYLLNPVNTGTSGTVASTATCEVGPIPALKEVLVTSAKLTECFGAFQRADVRLTIQTDQTNLTAKLRVTDPSSGSTTTDLGTGISVAVQ